MPDLWDEYEARYAPKAAEPTLGSNSALLAPERPRTQPEAPPEEGSDLWDRYEAQAPATAAADGPDLWDRYERQYSDAVQAPEEPPKATASDPYGFNSVLSPSKERKFSNEAIELANRSRGPLPEAGRPHILTEHERAGHLYILKNDPRFAESRARVDETMSADQKAEEVRPILDALVSEGRTLDQLSADEVTRIELLGGDPVVRFAMMRQEQQKRARDAALAAQQRHEEIMKDFEPTVGGRLKNFAGGVAQGASGVASGVAKTPGIVMELLSRDAERRTYGGANPARFVNYTDFSRPGEEEDIFHPKGKTTSIEAIPLRGAEDTPFWALGESIDRLTEDMVDPRYAELFTTKLGQGVGSTAAFAVGGLASAGLGAGGLVGASALGAASQGAGAFEEARAMGADDSTAFKAWFLNLGVGATEGVPIGRWTGRLGGKVSGFVARATPAQLKSKLIAKLGERGAYAVMNGLDEMTEEGLQELGQTIGEGLVARALYDPERDVWNLKDLAESAAIGMLVGAGGGAVSGGMSGRQQAAGERESEVMDDLSAISDRLYMPDGTLNDDVSVPFIQKWGDEGKAAIKKAAEVRQRLIDNAMEWDATEGETDAGPAIPEEDVFLKTSEAKALLDSLGVHGAKNGAILKALRDGVGIERLIESGFEGDMFDEQDGVKYYSTRAMRGMVDAVTSEEQAADGTDVAEDVTVTDEDVTVTPPVEEPPPTETKPPTFAAGDPVFVKDVMSGEWVNGTVEQMNPDGSYAVTDETGFGADYYVKNGDIRAAEPTRQAAIEKQPATEVTESTEETPVVVTDAARVQEIRNSIAEGEMILKSGKNTNGADMEAGALATVRRSVLKAKEKIGETSETPLVKTNKKPPPANVLYKKDDVVRMKGESEPVTLEEDVLEGSEEADQIEGLHAAQGDLLEEEPVAPSEESLTAAMDAIEERPQATRKENSLREEFGEGVIDSLREQGFVVGRAGYNTPLDPTSKGREKFFGKRPHDWPVRSIRNKELVVAYEEITGKTFKPTYSTGKEISTAGGKYVIRVEIPLHRWNRESPERTLHRSLGDARAEANLVAQKEKKEYTKDNFLDDLTADQTGETEKPSGPAKAAVSKARKAVKRKKVEIKSDLAAKLAKMREAFEKDTLQSGVNPEHLRVTVDVLWSLTEQGVVEFADAALFVGEHMADLVDKIAPAMEAGWRILGEKRPELGLDKAGNLRDVLDSLAAEEEGQPEGDQEDERDSAEGKSDVVEPPGLDEEESSIEGGTPTDTEEDGGETGPSDASGAKPPGGTNVEAGPPGGRGAGDSGQGTDSAGDNAGGKPGATESEGDTAAGQDRGDVNKKNHRIGADDSLIPGSGKVAKYNANVKAIRLLKKLEKQDREATPEEKRVLAQFVGWGGLAEALDDGKKRAAYKSESWEKTWEKRYDTLKELLTEAEWVAAQGSTENAHYTSASVIRNVWAAAERLGFSGGKVGEFGAGVGHFLGLAPESVADQTSFRGVELDSLTGRILGKLYPEAKISVEGLENVKIPPASLDMVIGNFPFAANGPYDPNYPNFSMHNYFFARAIDAVRPGGLVLAITSTSTMDSSSSREARKYLAERGELLGAIRLPNDAFKANAGTGVTTDLVILRRRGGGVAEVATSWQSTYKVSTHNNTGEVWINDYFNENSDMMLGRVVKRDMYGADAEAENENAALERVPGTSVDELFEQAIERLPENALSSGEATTEQNTSVELSEDSNKNGSYVIEDGKVLLVQDGNGIVPTFTSDSGKSRPWNDAERARAKDYVGVREAIKKLLRLQVSDNATDEEIEAARKEMGRLYDAFVKKHSTKKVVASPGSTTLMGHVKNDPEFQVVRSVEDRKRVTVKSDAGNDLAREVTEKGQVFSERTGWPWSEPETAKSPMPAAMISLAYKGTLDVPYMAGLLDQTVDQTEKQLLDSGSFYRDPKSGLIIEGGEYLSGNVRVKLTQAEAAGKAFEANVKALKEVQPEKMHVDEIDFILGGTWLPPETVTAWLRKLFGDFRINATFGQQSGVWSLHNTMQAERSAANTTYGVSGDNGDRSGGTTLSALRLIEATLNLNRPTMYGPSYIDEFGNSKRDKDADATVAAHDMQKQLSREFVDWAKSNEDATVAIEEAFNENFNSTVERQYPLLEEFDVFPGASSKVNGKEFLLRPHQRRAVARGLQESMLLAHAVGSGKTAVLTTLAMEMKRLGTARKVMIVVHNSTISQFGDFIPKLYPSSKVLVTSEKDLSAKNRNEFMARVASNDYDVVMVTQSQFDQLPDNPKTVEAYMQGQLDEMHDAIAQAEAEEGKESPGVKALARQRRALIKRIREAMARKVDSTIFFEDMGIDALMVDEAHNYKKNFFQSKLPSIKGLDRSHSQRAMGLTLKINHVHEKTGGKNVILATGTPVTNTLAEVWNMVRYVRPDILKQWGIKTFDQFASSFTTPETLLERSGSGAWKLTERLSKYINSTELSKMFRSAADIVLPEEMEDIERPEIEGGKPEMVELERYEGLDEYTNELDALYTWFDAQDGNTKKENSHVPLVIYDRGRKSTTDMRLVDKNAKDDPKSKLNAVVSRILKEHKRLDADKGVQAVFLDLYRSPKTGFDAWQEIKKKLIKGGMRADQIGIISDYSKKNKELLFSKVNSGDIRVVIGSSSTLGTGVNIQERLAVMHEVDAPHRPSDMEQREGRMLRQDNMFDTVRVIRYGVESTLDAGRYQALERKQNMINQVVRGQVRSRTLEDGGGEETSVSYAEAAALFSGDPRAMRRVVLMQRIAEIGALKGQWQRKLGTTRDQIKRQRSDSERLKTRGIPTVEDFLKDHADAYDKDTELSVKIEGETTTGRKEVVKAIDKLFGQTIANAIAESKRLRPGDSLRHRGSTFEVNGVTIQTGVSKRGGISVSGSMDTSDLSVQWEIEGLGEGWVLNSGNARGGQGFLREFSRVMSSHEGKLEELREQQVNEAKAVEGMETFLNEPFEHEQEEIDKQTELAAIERELRAEAPEKGVGADTNGGPPLVGGEDLTRTRADGPSATVVEGQLDEMSNESDDPDDYELAQPKKYFAYDIFKDDEWFLGEPPNGQELKIKGHEDLDLFTYKGGGEWRIASGLTGRTMQRGDTKTAVIAAFTRRIADTYMKDRVIETIGGHLSDTGATPRYRYIGDDVNDGGVSYSPSVSGSPASSPTSNTPSTMKMKGDGGLKKVKPSQIIAAAQKITGAAIRYKKGWFAQRKASGFYDERNHLIRNKRYGDLPTLFHEIGHSIHSKVMENKKKGFPTEVRKELLAMGKELYGDRKPNGGYLGEGVAEMVALDIMGESRVYGVAPNAIEWFHENYLRNDKEMAKKYGEVVDLYRTWREQGAVARIGEKIEYVETGWKGMWQRVKALKEPANWSNAWNVMMSMWATDAAPLDRAVSKLLTSSGLSINDLGPNKNPSILYAALKMNAPGTASFFLRDAAVSTRGEVVGDSLADVLQPVKGDMKNFMVYAYAKRALSLLNRRDKDGRPTPVNPGISRPDASYAVSELETPEFLAAVEGITEWADYLMDYLVEAGGLGQEAAEALRATNPIYVPLKRYFDKTYQGGAAPGKRGVVNQGKPVFKIVGSERSIIDPLEALVQQAETIISTANKMRVARSIAQMSESIEGAGWFANKIEPPKERHGFTLGDIEDQLVAMGVELGEAELDQVLTTFNNATRFTGKENVVVIWRGGKREFWELDADVFRVVTDMDKQYLHPWAMAWLGIPKRMVQLGAVGLSASFGLVRNPIRDSFTWLVYSSASRKRASATLGPLQTIDGFWQEITKSPEQQKWLALGGQMSTLMGQDRSETKRNVEEAMARTGKEKMQNVYHHPLDAMRALFGAFESAPRLTEFKRVLEESEAKWGKGSEAAAIEALLASKDVTVNFTRAGVIASAINMMTPFFNARIQGADKFRRTFLGMPGRTSLRATAAAISWITIPSLLLWALNKDEEWYEELPDWQRFGYWNFSTDGGKTIMRIPKPFELGYVFGSVPEALVNHSYKNDKDSRKEINDAMKAAFVSLLPAESITGALPAFVKPWEEVRSNRNSFLDRPINSPYEIGQKEDYDLYNRWTTEFAKTIGKVGNWSPKSIEHLLSGYTGGLGLDAVRLAESTFGRLGLMDAQERSGISAASDIPAFGTLFSRSPYGGGKGVNDFYDRREALRKKKGSDVASSSEKLELSRLESDARRISALRDKAYSAKTPSAKDRYSKQITAIARTALGRKSKTAPPPRKPTGRSSSRSSSRSPFTF